MPCALTFLVPDANGVPMNSTDVVVTICSDGSLCCGGTKFSEECCRDRTGFQIVNGQVVKAAQTSETSSSTKVSPSPTTGIASAAEVPSPPPTIASSPPSDSPEPNTDVDAASGGNKATIIGSVLGSVAGLLLIAVLALLFQRRRQRSGGGQAKGSSDESCDVSTTGTAKAMYSPPVELEGGPPSELETDYNRVYTHELYGTRRI